MTSILGSHPSFRETWFFDHHCIYITSQMSFVKKMNKESKGRKGKTSGARQSNSNSNAASTVESSSQNEPKRQESPEDLSRIMTECSLTAQALKKNIHEKLESIGTTSVGNLEKGSSVDQPASLVDTNIKIREVLEKSIKEKLSDLEEALKGEDVVGDSEVQTKADDVMVVVPEEPAVQPVLQVASEVPVGQPIRDKHSPSPMSSTSNPPSTVTAPIEPNVQPTKKKEKKLRWDRLTVDQVAKKLNSSPSMEDLQAVTVSYLSQCEELRVKDQKLKQHEKAFAQIVREKDVLQGDHNRLILAKSRLENLCRELQRQNKVIKEESLSRIKAEEEKRRQIANKFQTTLNEIMQLVQENQERNVTLKTENQELASKLKLLMDHYEVWEKNVEKIIQRKDLEGQLMNAKMAQTGLLFNQEKEQFLLEKQQLFMKISELQQKGILMSQTEKALKEELDRYTSKYQDFNEVLSKSNETFSGFKKDMEKMSKQIKKLEKETIAWKNKFEACNQTLTTVSADRNSKDQQLLTALNKVQTLEKLCRALQDRKDKAISQCQESSQISSQKE